MNEIESEFAGVVTEILVAGRAAGRIRAGALPDRSQWLTPTPPADRAAPPTPAAPAAFNFKAVLQEMIQRNASDLHLKVGRPPTLRLHGELDAARSCRRCVPRICKALAEQLMTPRQVKEFAEEQGVRLRASACRASAASACNVYQQRGSLCYAMRAIPYQARTIAELNLPPVLEEIAIKPRGLVLVTGVTGSGKSTALAAMIQHINENRHANVITIEDPIEFLHRDINCHINQREVGTDTATFGQALRRVLRQDPGRHPHRRNSRPRNARHGAQGGRHGPPRVLDAAHDGRDADDQPRAVVLSAAPAGRSALLARQRAAGGRLAAPRAARRQAGPHPGVRGAHQHRRRARQHPRHGQDRSTFRTSSRKAPCSTACRASTSRSCSWYSQGVISYESAVFYATSPSEFALRVQGVAGTSDTSWSDSRSDAMPNASEDAACTA